MFKFCLVFLLTIILLLVGCAPTQAPGETVDVTRLPATAVSPTPSSDESSQGIFRDIDLFCSHIPRPVMIIATTDGYAISNPLTGEQCSLKLPANFTDFAQINGAYAYGYARDDNNNFLQIQQLAADGTVQDLDFTMPQNNSYLYGFTFSADGRQLIWATTNRDGDNILSHLWLADLDGQNQAQLVADWPDVNRLIQPVRTDGDTVYFTPQPDGIGGSWNAFDGRYDSLYSVTPGSEPQKIFACADLNLTLCIGDISPDNEKLVYIDRNDNSLHLIHADGCPITTRALSGDYSGYPTFLANGDLVYYTAVLHDDTDGFPAPQPGTLHLLKAPYNGTAQEIITADNITFPIAQYDAQHIIISTKDEAGQSGNALLNLTNGAITPLQPWPDVYFVDLLTEAPQTLAQLPADLLAHNWQLVGAGGEADDMFLANPPAWLRFTADPDPNNSAGFSFEGFSGCNTLFGSYVVANETLVLDIGQTEQACGDDFMAFENFMLEILRNSPSFNILPENDALFLILQLPDNESDRLVFSAKDDPSDCNRGVITPEDARCYATILDPTQVQIIDAKTVVLFAEPQTIADWAGAAVIYHIPTHSTLVLDQFGDVDPQASIFSSRAGAAAFSELVGNSELMAGLKEQMQLRWQTNSSNEPEIRLGTAWQDGQTTIFLIAIAGLAATDDRFYCPGQTWTIGNNTEEIVADCVAQEAGMLVSHTFFEAKTIKGSSDRSVQIALDGAPSNVVEVSEGQVAQETAVYQAVLQYLSNRALIIHGETAPGSDDVTLSATAVDPILLQNYLTANEFPNNLRFLFYNSNAYFVQPSETIARDYLSATDPQQACEQFHSEYPGLGGIVTLSRIGMDNNGLHALVRILFECASADRRAVYMTLARSGELWQVTDEIAAASN